MLFLGQRDDVAEFGEGHGSGIIAPIRAGVYLTCSPGFT
jgi:hypothetical protein